MREIVLAAFRVDESNSVAYRKYRTLPGFLKGLGQVIEDLKPDYISIRVIQDSSRSET